MSASGKSVVGVSLHCKTAELLVEVVHLALEVPNLCLELLQLNLAILMFEALVQEVLHLNLFELAPYFQQFSRDCWFSQTKVRG